MSSLTGPNPALKTLCIQKWVEENPTASPNFNSSGNSLEANVAVFALEQWMRLKSDAPIDPINFPKVMRQIEQKYSQGIGFQTELQTQSAFSFRAAQLGLPSNCKVNLLFYDLAKKLMPEYRKAGLLLEERMSLERIPVDLVEFVRLQTKLNEIKENQALEQIWTQRLSGVFQLDQASEPREHEAIRAWLNNPANVQAIANVRILNLSNLSLKVLPKEISLLKGLQRLDLSNNQLRYLPETLGDLKALTHLGLKNNRLNHLPESFGNLAALTVLSLENNRISHLPESFGNFEDFEFLFLYDNPLFFISDIELKKEPSQSQLMEHRADFLSYSSESHLGCLFRNLMDRNADGAAVQFELLPDWMKSRIELRIRRDLVSQGTANFQGNKGADPFENILALARAVRVELYESFASLDEEQKNAVYSQIGKLAGHEEDLTWAEEHAFEHVLRFVDAYASVVFEEASPMKKKQKAV